MTLLGDIYLLGHYDMKDVEEGINMIGETAREDDECYYLGVMR